MIPRHSKKGIPFDYCLKLFDVQIFSIVLSIGLKVHCLLKLINKIYELILSIFLYPSFFFFFFFFLTFVIKIIMKYKFSKTLCIC